MKTSNKLLLGIFFGIIILTTAVQLMVYAKYKRGEYTAFQREMYDTPLTQFTLPPIRYISITGLGNCVIRNSDSTKLEVENYKNSQILYSVKNDTLIINSASMENNATTGKSGNSAEPQNFNKVNVYVPAAVPIRAATSILYIIGSVDTVNAPSYTLYMVNNSNLHVISQSRDKKNTNLNHLNIGGESSHIYLDHNAIVNSLQLQLINSSIDDKQAEIGNLIVNADSNSIVTLSGKNVKALK